jgi:hypothetical protein
MSQAQSESRDFTESETVRGLAGFNTSRQMAGIILSYAWVLQAACDKGRAKGCCERGGKRTYTLNRN